MGLRRARMRHEQAWCAVSERRVLCARVERAAARGEDSSQEQPLGLSSRCRPSIVYQRLRVFSKANIGQGANQEAGNRCAFFVGVSRAKRRLVLTHADRRERPATLSGGMSSGSRSQSISATSCPSSVHEGPQGRLAAVRVVQSPMCCIDQLNPQHCRRDVQAF